MLPHIADRPLSLVRCPDGAGQPCFFQKHVNPHAPPRHRLASTSPTRKPAKSNPTSPFPLNRSPRRPRPDRRPRSPPLGLHQRRPRAPRPHHHRPRPRRLHPLAHPRRQPPPKSARTSKSSNLESFLKTTGGKGLHVVIPIEPKHDWPTVKTFAHNFVLAMREAEPQPLPHQDDEVRPQTAIYLDYLRNERGATAVAAFSPRARAGLQVSMPLAWSELKAPTAPTSPSPTSPTGNPAYAATPGRPWPPPAKH